MKTLLILRHAKSAWEEPGLSDHDRPLNKRGRRDAPRMGELIRESGQTPDLIITSTAKRAVKTAEKVAESCGYDGQIEHTGSFYLASPPAYIDALRILDNAHYRVMVVGHNPGLEELIHVLTGTDETFPTAALAQVELDITTWIDLQGEGQGRLINLFRPRDLES